MTNLFKWAWLPILVVFALIASPHLGYPSKPVFDEIYTALAAQEFVEGHVPHEQTHPPLSKLFMAASYLFWYGGRFQEATEAWSPIAFAIRTPSVVAGICSLGLIYLLGIAMFDDRRRATLAMALLAMDSLFLVLSRTAMTNIYGMCFLLLCTLGTWLSIKRQDPRWLFLAGAGLGLGGASRWTALVGGSLCVLLVWAYLGGKRASLREWGRWWAFGFAAMAVLPVLIYLSTFFPQVWMATHHDLGKVFSLHSADYLVRVHKFAVNSHKLLGVPNPDYSRWYTWPFMLSPAWFFISPTSNTTQYIGIWAIGNGLIWWAMLPVLAYGLHQGLVRKRREVLALVVMALGLWLVWAAARSPINYLHYMFEVVPFLCLLIADALVKAWEAPDRWRLPARAAVGAYLGLTLAWAVWFYPLLTAQQVDYTWYRRHLAVGPASWDETTRLAAWRKENHLEDNKAYAAFLKTWYPTSDTFLQLLSEHDELRHSQREHPPQPGKSPASK
ncbi:MAG: phospholipid carrier-dependent glycosyltransferase [Cyanobacteria bacterium RYN_339]|nr:phospholipid carrier-dependent glycosyltransferase [Cyanobacteria bacterium RYN_339]